MHTDARSLEDGSRLRGDVCVVGAGAAGISLALALEDSSLDVVLLEGGGFEVEEQFQNLHAGDVVGRSYYPLEHARLHAFGGTTAHWSGYSCPAPSHVFEEREWVPHSGWPIDRDELDPYYRKAEQLLEYDRFDTLDEQIPSPSSPPVGGGCSRLANDPPARSPLPLRSEAVRTRTFQLNPIHLGETYRKRIASADNVHLYTHANVTEIVADESVSTIDELVVETLQGKRHRAEASRYVLACGALQTVRLLLASNDRRPEGLGNEHDLVGRFFMDHLELPCAQLVLSEPRPMALYELSQDLAPRGELALTPELQRELEVLDGSAWLKPGVYDKLEGTFQRNPPEMLEVLRGDAELEDVDRNKEGAEKSSVDVDASERRAYKMHVRQEPAPNPNSRVRLDDETDALGVPRIALDWQLSELDKRSIRRLFETLGREFGRSGLGRIKLLPWLLEDDSSWPDFVSGGWHHMGTTRMAAEPANGVVDPDCRVHGLADLYIAGSGVFPNAGGTNPTMTLIALAFRLADHLESELD